MTLEPQPDFFLASTEGYNLDRPRRCWRLREVSINESRGLLIRTEPPVVSEQDPRFAGCRRDLVLVSPRHRDVSLSAIAQWPVYVYIAIPIVNDAQDRVAFELDEIKMIAWGELYETEEAAGEKQM